MSNTQNTKLTAQQRAALFSASTRQHFQMIGQQDTAEATTLEFRVPKARILQGIRLYVEADVQGAGDSALVDKLAAYDILRRISIDLNNGFSPIVCGGREMAYINMLYPNAEMVVGATDSHTLCQIPESIKAGSNKFEFMLDLPLTLNYRDTSGLILAQNAETTISVVCDIANASVIAAGATYNNVKVTAMTTTFSVPRDSQCFPDLSILRVVDSRSETFTAGSAYVKLPTGMIYRKLILCFTDAEGNPMTPEQITSNIELVLNTADIPYSISPKMLRAVNKMQNGVEMPTGVYFWSFDYQGVIGMGGSRDYIDAERVSEFSVRFNAACAGKVTVISEKLSRLIANA